MNSLIITEKQAKEIACSENKKTPSIYDQMKGKCINSAVMSAAEGGCGVLGENDATMDEFKIACPDGENYAHICEETNPSSVDLSSFKVQNSLNKDFWKDDKLDSQIRLKLLDIAKDFLDTLDVSWAKPKDIIMTGSLANYNWNKKHSDIDLHILMDFKDIDDRVEFVKHYCDSQKNIWNQKHEKLEIKGFPVEVYVQDVNETAVQGGTYSLNKDKWINKPDKEEMSDDGLHKDKIRKKVAQFMDRIEEIEQNYKDCGNDSYKARKLADKASKLFKEIKDERAAGLKKDNKEMTDSNIVFKALRRLGYLDRLDKMRNLTYDKEMSLNESIDKQTVYLMVGIPGSGKSTWIDNNLGDIDVVSRDIIRAELGFTHGVDEKAVCTKEQEQQVTDAEYAKIKELAHSGKDFVIDDTNTGRFRAKMIEMLRSYGLHITVVKMDTDIETCIKRRDGQIPADIMRKIYAGLIEPQENEYDDIIHVPFKNKEMSLNEIHMPKFTAYHGTPHDFIKFRTDNIGSGEGNQSFGYGLYFTDNKKVAEYYADLLGNGEGNVYTVEINEGNFFSWLEKLDKELIEEIIPRFREMGIDELPIKRILNPTTRDIKLVAKPIDEALEYYPNGKFFYENVSLVLGGDKEASDFLHTLGFIGIKYPVGAFQNKRMLGSNYVIFSGEDVHIIDKRHIFNTGKNEEPLNESMGILDEKFLGLADWIIKKFSKTSFEQRQKALQKGNPLFTVPKNIFAKYNIYDIDIPNLPVYYEQGGRNLASLNSFWGQISLSLTEKINNASEYVARPILAHELTHLVNSKGGFEENVDASYDLNDTTREIVHTALYLYSPTEMNARLNEAYSAIQEDGGIDYLINLCKRRNIKIESNKDVYALIKKYYDKHLQLDEMNRILDEFDKDNQETYMDEVSNYTYTQKTGQRMFNAGKKSSITWGLIVSNTSNWLKTPKISAILGDAKKGYITVNHNLINTHMYDDLSWKKVAFSFIIYREKIKQQFVDAYEKYVHRIDKVLGNIANEVFEKYQEQQKDKSKYVAEDTIK